MRTSSAITAAAAASSSFSGTRVGGLTRRRVGSGSLDIEAEGGRPGRPRSQVSWIGSALRDRLLGLADQGGADPRLPLVVDGLGRRLELLLVRGLELRHRDAEPLDLLDDALIANEALAGERDLVLAGLERRGADRVLIRLRPGL